MERIVPTGNGYWVYGRGCTEPGGGIIPAWGFVPNRRSRVVGFGDEEILAPAATTKTSTPWKEILVTTVVGSAAGWLIEEVATHFRGRR
jgi:hypothetical protein